MYIYWSGELFMQLRECYFGVYFPRCEATWGMNTKLQSSECINSLSRQYIFFLFLTRHNKPTHDDKKTFSAHRLRVSRALFASC